MAKKSCDIYGPDLSIAEGQGRKIADMGLACMRKNQSTGESESSKGQDVSQSELEKWEPKP